MRRISYNEAESLARRVGSRDPFDAFDYLNVKLKWSDHHPADGLKGFATIVLRQKYVVLNSSLNRTEAMIVAAHELGHIKLHANSVGIFHFVDFDLCHDTDLQENEASLFGADFLISDEDVLELIQYDENCNFYNVAARLYVPVPFFSYKVLSMISRGYRLNLPEGIDSHFLRKPLHGNKS